jgi:glycosyltransferase involved in cell wall biosynthesis
MVFNRCLYLANLLKRRHIDHIHSHFALEAAQYAMFSSMLSGIPFSFTTHGNDIYYELPDDFTMKARRAKFIVAVSDFNRRHLTGQLNAPPQKVKTIHNGIDTAAFRPGPTGRKSLNRPPVLLTVARLHPVKGLEYLIQAYRILKDREIPFTAWIIGDGPERNRLQAQVEASKLHDEVCFLGNRAQDDVLAHYQKADMFILSSLSEGMPIVLLEAMACGLPVVATRVKGIPEVVAEGETGLMVPPEDPPRLAESIIHLINNPSLAASYGRQGMQRVSQNFTLSRNVRKLKDLFTDREAS